ncbi:hypothetical protein OPT61_g6966 [Boeremia exigua]|uniref:Uncharacterized protein n=1 Tax=Boeremia exigua TaxID=749465 RepID=A0ACC2I423_9PLEO|nr:hypothetical protein OPT61_g6966 [Boeremia exigua]
MEPSPPNREWIELQARHEQERAEWLTNLEDRKRKLQSEAGAEKARLMAKHSQEDSDFWRRHHENTPALPGQTTTEPQTGNRRLSTVSNCAPGQGSTPTANLAKNQPPYKAPSSSAAEQISDEVFGSSCAAIQAPEKEREVISLCSSDEDDDMLVEVSKEAVENEWAAAIARIPTTHPRTPPATAQVFEKSGQKPLSNSGPSHVKQENPKATRAQSRSPRELPSTVFYASHDIRNGRSGQRTSKSEDVLMSDGDVRLEDALPVQPDIDARLKRLDAGASSSNSLSATTPFTEATEPSLTRKITNMTQLPSPSPSIASASLKSSAHEAAVLLNAFKKPTLPSISARSSEARARTVGSQASSCTLGPTLAPVQSSSTVPPTRWKRKAVDLSDDEQSDYAPSETSTAAARKKAAISLGSPLKKRIVPNKTSAKSNRPPPLPASPAGRTTNSFGFRTTPAPASPNTAAIPPRTSTIRYKPTTPITPDQSFDGTWEEAPLTPSRKRQAAVNAQSEIEKQSEAEEIFHTDDQIFLAAAREARHTKRSTADLGVRLRSMSITPVPRGKPFGASKNTMVSDAPKSSGSASTAAGTSNKVSTTKSRATGSQSTARTRDISKLVGDDSDEDLDTSMFTCVNGIIIQKGQEGRMAVPQTKARRR